MGAQPPEPGLVGGWLMFDIDGEKAWAFWPGVLGAELGWVATDGYNKNPHSVKRQGNQWVVEGSALPPLPPLPPPPMPPEGYVGGPTQQPQAPPATSRGEAALAELEAIIAAGQRAIETAGMSPEAIEEMDQAEAKYERRGRRRGP